MGMYKDCKLCGNFHTDRCPNSALCFAREDKPYFKAASPPEELMKEKGFMVRVYRLIRGNDNE